MILLLAKITDSLFNHSVSKMRPKRAFYGQLKELSAELIILSLNIQKKEVEKMQENRPVIALDFPEFSDVKDFLEKFDPSEQLNFFTRLDPKSFTM